MPFSSDGVPDAKALVRKTGKTNINSEKLDDAQPKPFLEMTRAEVDAYIDANVQNTADVRKLLKRIARIVYDLGKIVTSQD